jgi:hypothetical protein
MATKIGFDPSLATPGVDWSVVTTSVIDGLNALEERREKARKNVDTKTREEVDVLRNVEMGKDAQVNEFVMDAREQLTETSLMDKRLWENGILSTKDFLRNNNNRTTGTASLINSFKTYNADYDRIVKGVEDKTLSRITLNRKAQVEKLFDMRTHAFVVNPTTGEPNIVKRDANGAPSSDPNDIVNSSVVDFLSTADVKYFNAQTTAKGIVDSLGQRLIRDGLGKTTKGAYLALDSAGEAAKAQLKSAREEAIDVALMGSNMASFLVDSGDYDTTTNKDEADKNDKLILENPDGTFEYDEKQKTEAKLRFDRLLESMIPRSEEAALPKTPSASATKAAKSLKVNTDLGNTIVRIITAENQSDLDADLGVLQSDFDFPKGRITALKKTQDGFIFQIYRSDIKDFENVPVDFTKDDVKTSVERTLKRLLGAEVDVEEIMNALDSFEGKKISSLESTYKPTQAVKILDVDDRLNVLTDPTSSGLQPTSIMMDDLISNVENQVYDKNQFPKVLKTVFEKQGFDDVLVVEDSEEKKYTTRGRGNVPVERMVDRDFVTITSQYLDEPIKIYFDSTQSFGDIVKEATEKRQSQQPFGSTRASAPPEETSNQRVTTDNPFG